MITPFKIADDRSLPELFIQYDYACREAYGEFPETPSDEIERCASLICDLFLQRKMDEADKTGENINKLFHAANNLLEEIRKNTLFGFGQEWYYLKKIIEFFTTIQIGAIAYDVPKKSRDKYSNLLEIGIEDEPECYLLSLNRLEEYHYQIGGSEIVKTKTIILFNRSYAIAKLSAEGLDQMTPESFDRAFKTMKPIHPYYCSESTHDFKTLEFEAEWLDYKIITGAALLMGKKLRSLVKKLDAARQGMSEKEFYEN